MSDHEDQAQELGADVEMSGQDDGKSELGHKDEMDPKSEVELKSDVETKSEVEPKPTTESPPGKEHTMDVTDEDTAEASKATDHDKHDAPDADAAATMQAAIEEAFEDEDEEFGKKKVPFSLPTARLALLRIGTKCPNGVNKMPCPSIPHGLQPVIIDHVPQQPKIFSSWAARAGNQ